ncbi:uncharacterized protein LOC109283246 isoform X1 [Alligator mississippiensis]|uniref:uncharacterized protein LOC109283246 isoform X1 n=1 Tax=Alligator mississippiensis TaxID=8496 RepID=UPI0028774DED|nr:uncharacterized protein LOC109283246 isoform X1 [Alligator mississippiensis]
MLPKIHKQGNPGRPIISNHGTLTEEISGFVESILKPLVTHKASFVQDTIDFLRKLKNIDHLPSNTLLATMDVTSLYTNIPHQDGIQACLTYLQEQDYNSEYRPKDITDLIHFILTHNYFTFNNQQFLQMMGTAMGTKMAPQYANLFMSHLEEDFLKNCTIKPLLYLRYIDDIFIIWTENLQSLIEFHQKFNSHHPSIRLSLEYSSTNISFLDTMISIQKGKIQTTVYKKPTDQHTYLHRTSNHPKHTKKAVIYSQALRYHHICTEENTQDCHLTNLKKAFTQQGHSSREVNCTFERATWIPREELLQYRRKPPTNRTPLVMTYHPSLEPVETSTTEQVTKRLDTGGGVDVVYLDFRKAFDTVSHPILVNKLRGCDMDDCTVRAWKLDNTN